MKDTKTEQQTEFQKKISERLSSTFESTIKEKEEYYRNNPDKIPVRKDVTSIISAYSYKNAAITGGLSLIPGPWGLLAAVPEIIMVVKNQISMVYDIGLAYGQNKVLNKEVLMFIVANAMGNATGSLAVMHGSKLLIKRASLRVMQQLIRKLAGSIAQKILRSMVAKWLPIVGAAALATWTKFSTTSIGKKAAETFEKEIEFDESSEITEIEEISDEQEVTSNHSDETNTDVVKLSEAENEYIEEFNLIIEDSSELSDKERKMLNRLRDKLKISEARALELELQILNKNTFTENELDFLQEIEFCLEDDKIIDDSEMRMLNRKREKLGITEERGNELIALIKKQKGL